MNLIAEDTISLDKMRSMTRLELESLIYRGQLRGVEPFDVYLEVSSKEAEARADELDKLGEAMGIAPDQARVNKYYAVFLRSLVGDKGEEATKFKVGLIQDRVTTLERIKTKLGSEHEDQLESIDLEIDAWKDLARSLLPKKE